MYLIKSPRVLISISFAALLALAACGGGTSSTTAASTGTATSTATGTGTGTSTTVTTTEAAISSTNAKSVAESNTTSMDMAESIATTYHQKANFKPESYDGGFGKPVADAIAALDGPRGAAKLAGTCGGTLTTTTGTGSTTFTFAQYCVGASASSGVTTDGTITATGTSASASVTLNLTISASSSGSTASTTMAGTLTAAMTSTTDTFTMDLTVTVVSGTTTYSAKMESYKMDFTHSGGAYSLTMSGKFYYDTAGYVTLSTPTALSGVYASGYGVFTAGELRMTGSGIPTTIVRAVYTSTGAAYSYSLNGGTTWIAVV